MNLKKKISKKIGILGGTFDPPHKGHLTISIFAIKKLKLDFLIWGVTKKNPFKKNPMFSLKKRLLLSKKIVKNNKKIKVHSYDKFLKSSETIKLIKYLKKKDTKNSYYFIMGSDNFVKFHSWKSWRKIAELCQIAIFPRAGYVKKSLTSKAFKALGKEKLMFLRSKMINISSSKVRKSYLK